MSKDEVIKYLEFCNAWRQCEECYFGEEDKPDPCRFAEAIEFAIDYLRKH